MSLKYFSVFSGAVYDLKEEYTNYLDCGQLKITDDPKNNCKRCHGRGFTGRNSESGHYDMCRCVLRNADDELLGEMSQHQVEDVTLHTKKSDFDNIVEDVYEAN
jgi:hypothetical protein|tara:strand:+ start:2039 stop:2350 length:312 start_codon:yes stop_codon:yes gene_type:complete